MMLVARFTDHSASRRREEEVPVPSTGPISARAQAKPLSLAEKRETPLRCAGRNPSRAHPYALHNGARLSAPPRIPTDLQCSPPASSLDRWYGWALRSRREPMKQVARTIKQYRDCILRQLFPKSNGLTEGINASFKPRGPFIFTAIMPVLIAAYEIGPMRPQ